MGNTAKMIQTNHDKSKAKVELATRTIRDMLNKDEQVVVCELQKRTGLSRAFFYNNEEVHTELVRAQQLQEGQSFVAPQKVIINKAMDKEIELLKKKLSERDTEIQSLKDEIVRLKKLANAKTLSTLKSL